MKICVTRWHPESADKEVKLNVITLAALIAGLIFAPLWPASLKAAESEARAAQSRPNILFIFADDLGWGDLGCHGNKLVQTPNLDRLAAEGTDFHQFYVANPVCSPSRTAVMTGHYPARYSIHEAIGPIRKNAEGGSADWLDPRAPTLPRQLKAAGYTTGHFGKWHLSGEQAKDAPRPEAYGVDEHAVWVAGSANKAEHPQLFDLVVDFMRRHKERPFFMNVWLHEPHLAHTPSEESMKQFAQLDERQRVYSAAVADADKGVGKLLVALKQFGLENNTLVIFSSDNGPEKTGPAKTLRDGYGNYYAIGSTGGLRGRKRSLFDGGVRTPLIVRWPGRVPAKKVNNTSVVASVDLLPTLVAVTGAKLPAHYQADGENMLAALEGKEWRRAKPLFWEWRGIETQPETWPRLAVRDGDWKLVMTFDQSRVELYNLASDRAEAKNMAREQPKIVEQLTAKLLAWKSTLPKEPSPDCLSKARK